MTLGLGQETTLTLINRIHVPLSPPPRPLVPREIDGLFAPPGKAYTLLTDPLAVTG